MDLITKPTMYSMCRWFHFKFIYFFNKWTPKPFFIPVLTMSGLKYVVFEFHLEITLRLGSIWYVLPKWYDGEYTLNFIPYPSKCVLEHTRSTGSFVVSSWRHPLDAIHQSSPLIPSHFTPLRVSKEKLLTNITVTTSHVVTARCKCAGR